MTNKAYPVVPGVGHSGSRGRFEGRGEGAASLVAKGADHANWPPPAAAVRPGRPKLQEGATWDNGISHLDLMHGFKQIIERFFRIVAGALDDCLGEEETCGS